MSEYNPKIIDVKTLDNARDEIKKVLISDRVIKEINLVEELIKEITDKAVYGIKEVENASNLRAIEILLITDSLIQKLRANNDFDKVNTIMQTVDSNKGKIHIISSKHEGGKKLNGLSGIAAILRYKIE